MVDGRRHGVEAGGAPEAEPVLHTAVWLCCRGGPAAAAHIDILGNDGLLMDVIRVAAGRGHELADELHSDIDRIAASVDFGSA